MAALSIDRSVEFLLDDGIADDDAFRASLGVDSFVRVHSEHLLAKYKDALGINSAVRSGGYVALSFAQIHFALMRAIDLSNVKDHNAVILLRPHTLGMALATLKDAGGLRIEGKKGFGSLLKELARAAASAPPIKVTDADILTGDTIGASTWMEHMKVGMLLGPGATSGRVYAQFKTTFGGWVKAADVHGADYDAMLPLLRPLTGDLSGHGAALQARLVGQAFKQTAIPDLFDFIPDDAESELIRRASDDRFTPLFATAWTSAYATLATAGNYDNGAAGPKATVEEARTAVLAAALKLGLTASWGEPLVAAVDDSCSAQLALGILSDPGLAGADMNSRLMALARGVALAGSKGASSSADGSVTASSITAESSDESWGKAGTDPQFRELASKLNALNVIPLDVNAVGAVLMSHPSPAGLIYMNSKRNPDVAVFKDLTAVRASTVPQQVVCAAVCVDSAGEAQTNWGTPISEDACNKLLKGTWFVFQSITEAKVTFGKGSIDLWTDFVQPVIAKEFGEEAAAQVAPKGSGPFSIFESSALLTRSAPIVKRAFASIGITGKEAFSFAGLISNAASRLLKIEALPESKGKRAATNGIFFAVALSMQEGQRGYQATLASPIASARRMTSFYACGGVGHKGFTEVDSLLETARKRAREDAFAPDNDGSGKKKQGRGDGGDDSERKNDWGALVDRGLLWQTTDGGFDFGGGIVITPKDAGVVLKDKVDCPARLLCARESGSKDPNKAWSVGAKWCAQPRRCYAKYLNDGADPHASLPEGLAATDLVIVENPAERWKTASTVVSTGGRGGGKGRGTGGGKGGGRGGEKGKGKGGKGGKGGRGRGHSDGRGFGRRSQQ